MYVPINTAGLFTQHTPNQPLFVDVNDNSTPSVMPCGRGQSQL